MHGISRVWWHRASAFAEASADRRSLGGGWSALSDPRLTGRTDQAAGYSFIEITIVAAIIAILASAIMPLAKVTSQRQREAELRRDLRDIRTAIDKFKDAVDQGRIAATQLAPGSEGYPPTLDTLVVGVPIANDATGRVLKFLRRVPIDPMTRSPQWGLRSYQDPPDATAWGGQNVFDVYTAYDGTALDGTRYRDW